jgi:phosphopantothenoylcysteine decarboxylase/phosphopantothenate--cysteine ligase
VKSRPLVLVTAGPTRENIDPIRFISNRSTGTFGYAIAKEARIRGCNVVLVTGPAAIKPPAGVKTIRVESAMDMLRAVNSWSDRADYIFMAAAVSDWRVSRPAESKIKRSAGGAVKILRLVENPDILKGLKRRKGCLLTGFALESEDLAKNAATKLLSKKLDMIVANQIKENSNIFGDNRLDIAIIDRKGGLKRYRNRSKVRLAKIILDKAFSFNIK